MTIARRIGFLGPEILMGLESLFAHKLRSLLTMLGMIFGVGAVISMLSIGAGARQEALSFIETLGVNNVIVEALEASNLDELQNRRKLSPGLTFRDVRALSDNLPRVKAMSPRKRYRPSRVFPAVGAELPVVSGVTPAYPAITGLKLVAGRFFDEREAQEGAPVAVLGDGARRALVGREDPVGRYVKVDDVWLRVIGVAAPQATYQAEGEGLPAENRNLSIYVPLNAALLRFANNHSDLKDEIDGLFIQMEDSEASVETAEMARAILAARHRGAPDFSVVVPAGLLEEQRRTQMIFNFVMVAIAGISLLVGGIGIMNIMLATVLERTREIGIRRAIGARRRDIVRQFLLEATLISLVGGSIGVLFGVGLARLIALTAGWATIVSPVAILLAFSVSLAIGLIFGLYPARQAAMLDPIEAIRYE